MIELFAQARFQSCVHAFGILTLPNPGYLQLVSAIEVPSLLVIGDVGSIISPETAAELARTNPRLEVVQIAEAGHGIPYDQPERFSAVVQTFLRSVHA